MELVDPPVALAGQEGIWRLPMRLCEDIPKGACLKLQLDGNRNNHGEFRPAQVDRPETDGYLTIRAADGTALAASADETPGTFILQVPEEGLPAGAVLTVTLGDTCAGGGPSKAPTGRQLDKFFLLYRPHAPEALPTTWTDENQHCIVAACTMHILGGPLHHLRAYAPSQARPGESIDLLVRPEDAFSNLSHEPIQDVVALLGGQELPASAEPLNDSTCVRLGVRLPREGVHRVTVRDQGTGKEAVANPTICQASPQRAPLRWGMIHGHTEMSDGTGSIDYYFRQMRDEAAVDFAAPGDHDHLWETSDALWRVTSETVKRYHEPCRFVTLLGYEWAKWRQNGDGDRNVYYLADDRPMYRSDYGQYPTPPDLFRAIRKEQAIVIPHHTGHHGNFCDWKDHDPVHERLVEIFQVRGSYECSEEEGNPVPEHYDAPPFADGYVRRALAMGWRVGFTAGGDDHTGHAGTDYPITAGHRTYVAGLMSVPAAQLTRESIWDALWNRRVVATSGPRMILTYELNGQPLGSELNRRLTPELERSRKLRIEFHGTAPAERIDVVRNNEVVHTACPGELDCEIAWEDEKPLQEVLLAPAQFCPNLFCFYYVRAIQTDNELAWASPIWIDA